MPFRGVSYLSPHTFILCLMSVIMQATPSEDHDKGVATLSFVLRAPVVGQGRARDAELGKEWLCKAPKLLRPSLIPGKLAPNDRPEPQDRGQAACPRPLWA